MRKRSGARPAAKKSLAAALVATLLATAPGCMTIHTSRRSDIASGEKASKIACLLPLDVLGLPVELLTLPLWWSWAWSGATFSHMYC